jgi:hypothetical protein
MRFTELDFLRGLCLLLMTIDHFSDVGTVRFFGFFSPADGFVFISGIVAGIVYTNRLTKGSYDRMKSSAMKRALQIYKYHILCLLFLCLLILSGNQFFVGFYKINAGFFVENVFLAGLLNALFLYQIYHLDILPLYVVFVLLVPLALKTTVKHGPRVVLLVSASLWAVNLFGLTDRIYAGLNKIMPARAGEFPVLSWQFLFFLGFYFGYMKAKGNLRISFKRTGAFVCSLVILIAMFGLKWAGLPDHLTGNAASILFGRPRLGILRIIDFLALCYVLGYLLTKYRRLGGNQTVQLLGRHSLYVFTFQTLFLFLFVPFYHPYVIYGILAEVSQNTMMWKILALIVTLPLSLIILLPARYREHLMIRKRGPKPS